MLVTVLGIVTLVSLVHPPNALSPMLVTLLPIVDGGQVGAGRERELSDAGDAVGDRVTSSFAIWDI
jgi:hypothetical protein